MPYFFVCFWILLCNLRNYVDFRSSYSVQICWNLICADEIKGSSVAEQNGTLDIFAMWNKFAVFYFPRLLFYKKRVHSSKLLSCILHKNLILQSKHTRFLRSVNEWNKKRTDCSSTPFLLGKVALTFVQSI